MSHQGPAADINVLSAHVSVAVDGATERLDYYEVLEVTRDATQERIKRQYMVLARKFHPDKNAGSKEAEEKFKVISEAYQVLSDPKLRALYDAHGHEGLDANFVDPSELFSCLNGSERFEPYVGTLMLVALATSKEGELTKEKLSELQVQRVEHLVQLLQQRLAGFDAGHEDAWRASMTAEAQSLVKEPFGEVLLYAVGRLYEVEAEKKLKGPVLGVFSEIKRRSWAIKAQYKAIKAAVGMVALQQQAADRVAEYEKQVAQMEEAGEEVPPHLYEQLMVEMQLQAMSTSLAASWRANVVDIQSTLHKVCHQLLFNKGVPRAERKRRAHALKELGELLQGACVQSAASGMSQVMHTEVAKKIMDMLSDGAFEPSGEDSDGADSPAS